MFNMNDTNDIKYLRGKRVYFISLSNIFKFVSRQILIDIVEFDYSKMIILLLSTFVSYTPINNRIIIFNGFANWNEERQTAH